MKSSYVYPFPAVMGQGRVKKALILNVINPLIGGVLISGEKGTAKSTLVRGLSDIINDMKVINLPLNITEDRLVGTINIEKAIAEGKRSFEFGILKKAHGNILYVDEVNLLSQHIVNCLLEVAASGINHVEREGISYTHSSTFVLVGTMNPEEGSLRSQFLDRFGLYIEVKGSSNSIERKAIIKRRLEYEAGPVEFKIKWQEKVNKLSDKIIKAREALQRVQVSESIMKLAAQIASDANCSGHRAELVIIETSKAIAAFDNRKNIVISDIKEAAELAIPHRMRELPKRNSSIPQDENDENQHKNHDENNNKEKQNSNNQNKNDESKNEETEKNNNFENNRENDEKEEKEEKEEKNKDNQKKDNINDEILDDIGRTFTVKSLNIKLVDRKKRKGSGKRSKTKTDSTKGRYIRYIFPKDKVKDLAFDATLRAAAPYQSVRDKNGLAVVIKKNDFREKLREKRTGSTILFIVDASGSMGAKKRMEAVKGAVVSLLSDAYQKRDKVGMIAFRKKEAEVLLQITRSVELAQKALKELPTGGRTPLATGLIKGYEIIKAAIKRDPDIVPVIVLVSDGRANSTENGGDPFEEAINVAKRIAAEGIYSIVIDTEQGFIKLGLAKEIAEALNSQYYKLDELEAGEIIGVVKNSM